MNVSDFQPRFPEESTARAFERAGFNTIPLKADKFLVFPDIERVGYVVSPDTGLKYDYVPPVATEVVDDETAEAPTATDGYDQSEPVPGHGINSPSEWKAASYLVRKMWQHEQTAAVLGKASSLLTLDLNDVKPQAQPTPAETVVPPLGPNVLVKRHRVKPILAGLRGFGNGRHRRRPHL